MPSKEFRHLVLFSGGDTIQTKFQRTLCRHLTRVCVYGEPEEGKSTPCFQHGVFIIGWFYQGNPTAMFPTWNIMFIIGWFYQGNPTAKPTFGMQNNIYSARQFIVIVKTFYFIE